MDQLDEALARSRRNDLVAATRPTRSPRLGPAPEPRRSRRPRRRRGDAL